MSIHNCFDQVGNVTVSNSYFPGPFQTLVQRIVALTVDNYYLNVCHEISRETYTDLDYSLGSRKNNIYKKKKITVNRRSARRRKIKHRTQSYSAPQCFVDNYKMNTHTRKISTKRKEKT